MQKFLKPTYFFDFENPAIQKLVAEYQNQAISNRQKAIAIYRKVRDDWRYNPYHISFRKENHQASRIAQKDNGNCVEKSILLIACLRAVNIPARLHLGKVKNHLAVERLIEKFGSNELTPHGMVNLHLNGKWLKASPAFNQSLCHKFNVEPLEFDGKNSSFLQQFNNQGSLFMEYTDDYGYFADVPLAFMVKNLKQHYPHIFDTGNHITDFEL